jgi:predicted tellurium resistance membrane protein TerC
MPEGLFAFDSLAALAMLTLLEVVLGIDNVVVIAVVTSKLPAAQQPIARQLGLALAMIMRIVLLLGITWIMGLTSTIFTIDLPFLEEPIAISWKDLILIVGGVFLIFKATKEIHHKLEGGGDGTASRAPSFAWAIAQIVAMDMIFSLDSVITAVGVTNEGLELQTRLWIMIAAVVAAVVVMMIFAGAISRFVERHPSIKILALSFLILIGVLLLADGCHQHLNRGYVYFAMAFSLVVELINLRVRSLVGPHGT